MGRPPDFQTRNLARLAGMYGVSKRTMYGFNLEQFCRMSALAKKVILNDLERSGKFRVKEVKP